MNIVLSLCFLNLPKFSFFNNLYAIRIILFTPLSSTNYGAPVYITNANEAFYPFGS